MVHLKNITRHKFTPISLGVLFFIFTTLALAHGPKGHSSGDFTALQAAKKGIGLYDRLVSSGKLEESWEIDLINIEIGTQDKGGKKEYIVKFNRRHSEPRTVYIFFSENGEYKGSNFTGK